MYGHFFIASLKLFFFFILLVGWDLVAEKQGWEATKEIYVVTAPKYMFGV